jgi:hypothetical protein
MVESEEEKGRLGIPPPDSPENFNDAEPGGFEEAKRKYKALCYEDICLWIVRNPKQGERDLLAMEVHLQNHKGVDNKPKPYATLARYLES